MNANIDEADKDRPDPDSGSSGDAGAESPEEGHAAMEQAEDATVDDGD